MSRIVVKDRSIGSCTIEYKKVDEDENLTRKKELAIKALAALQLVCVTRNKDNEDDFDKIIKVLHTAIDEIDNINNPVTDEVDDEFFSERYN